MAARPLELTWPDRPRPDGVDVALGCAAGVRLRYELRPIARGAYELTVATLDPGKWEGTRLVRAPEVVTRRTRPFTSKRAAKRYARRDFSRRQVLREVPAS